MRHRSFLFYLLCAAAFVTSCSVPQRIGREARRLVLKDTSLRTAHVGISIFDAAQNRYVYEFQGDKYFVPASNTKIPTCYAAMKYLGDSIVGLRYSVTEDKGQRVVTLQPSGDPTFLQPEFKSQRVLRFLEEQVAVKAVVRVSDDNWKDESLGSGWTWNDYAASYMTERSAFPIYGNAIRFNAGPTGVQILPSRVDLAPGGADSTLFDFTKKTYRITRQRTQNTFLWSRSPTELTALEIPFITSTAQTLAFLRDTIPGLVISSGHPPPRTPYVIRSVPTDSLLRPMMHRSDNFYAEQSLLMVSNEMLGVMNNARIIDTLLKTDFRDLPQQPRWVDGSGLSRYNLFTPQDLVTILNKMRTEFGMARIKDVFATGGEGTISSYFKKDSTFIYAKTGTLSGVVALSGFLYTERGKLFIFSVLVNNHQASSTAVRRAVEKFLQGVRRRY